MVGLSVGVPRWICGGNGESIIARRDVGSRRNVYAGLTATGRKRKQTCIRTGQAESPSRAVCVHGRERSEDISAAQTIARESSARRIQAELDVRRRLYVANIRMPVDRNVHDL